MIELCPEKSDILEIINNKSKDVPTEEIYSLLET